MLCGEIQKVEVTLENVGNAPLTNIYIASTDAKLFTLNNTSNIDKSEGNLRRKRIPEFQFIFYSVILL